MQTPSSPLAGRPGASVIIVSWNVRDLLRRNLLRLLSIDHGMPIEVFVVDNGSHDGTRHMLRRDFPQVRLIANEGNNGFAKANNQALRQARGEVCILLNPDMLVEPGAIKAVRERLLADQTLGVVGIRLIGENGAPIRSVRRFPDFASHLALLLKLSHVAPSVMDRYHAAEFDYAKTQDVDQVRGSFFAFRRDLLERVGYLDERFFVWFEEVDYCRRVRSAGLRVEYFAGAEARDFVGRSFAQVRRLRNQRIFGASMAKYFRKHHPWWQAALLTLARPVGLMLIAVADAAAAVRRAL